MKAPWVGWEKTKWASGSYDSFEIFMRYAPNDEVFEWLCMQYDEDELADIGRKLDKWLKEHPKQ